MAYAELGNHLRSVSFYRVQRILSRLWRYALSGRRRIGAGRRRRTTLCANRARNAGALRCSPHAQGAAERLRNTLSLWAPLAGETRALLLARHVHLPGLRRVRLGCPPAVVHIRVHYVGAHLSAHEAISARRPS